MILYTHIQTQILPAFVKGAAELCRTLKISVVNLFRHGEKVHKYDADRISEFIQPWRTEDPFCIHYKW